jgi:hypothetical protein
LREITDVPEIATARAEGGKEKEMNRYRINVNSSVMGRDATEMDADRYAEWLQVELEARYPDADIRITSCEDESAEMPADTDADDDELADIAALWETYCEILAAERVIFDNAGGITVQLRGWAHYYQDETQAAEDVAEWIATHDTSTWEGHEPAALCCNPTTDEIRNGGYWIWVPGDDCPDEGSGHAADNFFRELARA